MFKIQKLRNRLCALTTGIFLTILIYGFLPTNIAGNSTPQSPWRGREVFHNKGCINCHSVYGKGGEGGPDLGKDQFYGTYLELAALMWNHFPKMSETMKKQGFQFPNLNVRETEQLITYLSYIRYMGETGDEMRGRKLLKSKGCFSCHKFGGSGGDIAPDFSTREEYISPLNLVESIWNHGPDMMQIFESYKIKRPEFKGNEIVDLASGIQSYMRPTRFPDGSDDIGDPVRGETLVEKKGCMHCHSFRGTGGNLGPDFDKVNLNCSVTQIAGKMWNHGPKMWEIMKREDITFPVFMKGEMADVIAYLYGLKLEDSPGDETAGQALLEQRKCLSCHSFQGQGSDIADDLADLVQLHSPLAMISAMWNHGAAMQEKLSEMKLIWPELTSKNMANLYAYLQSKIEPKKEEK
jgi:cytochrome c